MATSTFFWNMIANHYSKNPVANQQAYQKKLDETQSYLTPQSEVLEIGCGTGTTALHHAEKVNRILASDYSNKMIRIAKRKAKAQGITNVEFRCDSVENLQLEDERFDVALAMSILHLLEDKQSALQKIFKALKPGGMFLSSTALPKEIMPGAKVPMAVGRFFGVLPLVKFIDRTDLLNSITAAGFEVRSEWQPNKKEAIWVVARKPK